MEWDITVKDAETWATVKAYGTYEEGSPDDEVLEFNGKLYRCCFAELPKEDRAIILELYAD